MSTRTKRPRFNWQSALRNVVRLTLTAFQAKFPSWGAWQMVGLPTYQGLVESLNQYGSETPMPEASPINVKSVRPQTGLFDGDRRMAEPRRAVMPVVEDQNLLDYLAVREMSERYRRASSRTRLLSKEAQN